MYVMNHYAYIIEYHVKFHIQIGFYCIKYCCNSQKFESKTIEPFKWEIILLKHVLNVSFVIPQFSSIPKNG